MDLDNSPSQKLLEDGQLSEVTFSDKYEPQHVSHRSSLWFKTKVAALIIAITTAGFLFGRISHDLNVLSSPSTELTSLGHCPQDWREAKALGCMYDFVLSNWIHPRCHNEEMYQRYLGLLEEQNATYWREPEEINRVSFEESISGEHGALYSRGNIHHLHCSYALHRVINAAESTPKVLDSYCRRQAHIDHCLVFNGNPAARHGEIGDDEDTFTMLTNLPEGIDCLVG